MVPVICIFNYYEQLVPTPCSSVFTLCHFFPNLPYHHQSYIYLSTLLCYLSLRFFNLCYNDIYHDDKNNIYCAHLSDAICAGGWWVLAVSVGKGCHEGTSCVTSWGDTVTLPTEEAGD